MTAFGAQGFIELFCSVAVAGLVGVGLLDIFHPRSWPVRRCAEEALVRELVRLEGGFTAGELAEGIKPMAVGYPAGLTVFQRYVLERALLNVRAPEPPNAAVRNLTELERDWSKKHESRGPMTQGWRQAAFFLGLYAVVYCLLSPVSDMAHAWGILQLEADPPFLATPLGRLFLALAPAAFAVYPVGRLLEERALVLTQRLVETAAQVVRADEKGERYPFVEHA